jgi:hypothetical protein
MEIEKRPRRIVVQLDGGLVTDVVAGIPIEYIVEDCDVEDELPEKIRLNPNGERCYVGRLHSAVVDPDYVEDAFALAEDALIGKCREAAYRCKLCGTEVDPGGLRRHLEEHAPQACGMDFEDVMDCFRLV